MPYQSVIPSCRYYITAVLFCQPIRFIDSKSPTTNSYSPIIVRKPPPRRRRKVFQTTNQSKSSRCPTRFASNWAQSNLLEPTQILNRFPIQNRPDQARQQPSAGTARQARQQPSAGTARQARQQSSAGTARQARQQMSASTARQARKKNLNKPPAKANRVAVRLDLRQIGHNPISSNQPRF